MPLCIILIIPHIWMFFFLYICTLKVGFWKALVVFMFCIFIPPRSKELSTYNSMHEILKGIVTRSSGWISSYIEMLFIILLSLRQVCYEKQNQMMRKEKYHGKWTILAAAAALLLSYNNRIYLLFDVNFAIFLCYCQLLRTNPEFWLAKFINGVWTNILFCFCVKISIIR